MGYSVLKWHKSGADFSLSVFAPYYPSILLMECFQISVFNVSVSGRWVMLQCANLDMTEPSNAESKRQTKGLALSGRLRLLMVGQNQPQPGVTSVRPVFHASGG